MIKRYIKWIRFKNKIQKQLPSYHPKYGFKLEWDIQIIKVGIEGYDIHTGKITGYKCGRLVIKQKPPKLGAGTPVFTYDFKKKQVLEKKYMIWGL